MQDSVTGGHVLRSTGLNDSTATIGVLVQELPVDQIRESLKAAVWVPGCSLGFTGCVFNFTHLVHVNKWIKVALLDHGECAAHRKALTFMALGRGRDFLDRAGLGIKCHLKTRQCQSVCGHSGHLVSLKD